MAITQDNWPAGASAVMDVTYTQANAAGGAVVCEISPGAGGEFLVYAARAINSGTNGLIMMLKSVVNGPEIQRYTTVASGAGTSGYLGSSASVGLSAATFAPPGVLVCGTQVFDIQQTAAGAQNDTFHILICVRLKTGFLPTVTHADSTNPANVTVTAGAESFTTI